MSTAVCVGSFSQPSTCHPVVATRYEYLTVREVSLLLEKCESRLYAMIGEGLLDQVGFIVFRTKKGRIWIGVPRCGLSQLNLAPEKERGP